MQEAVTAGAATLKLRLPFAHQENILVAILAGHDLGTIDLRAMNRELLAAAGACEAFDAVPLHGKASLQEP
jgi:hypothetical protein